MRDEYKLSDLPIIYNFKTQYDDMVSKFVKGSNNKFKCVGAKSIRLVTVFFRC